MATPESIQPRENIDYGYGLVYIARYNSAGALGGERYVGVTESFTVTSSETPDTVSGGDRPTPIVLASRVDVAPQTVAIVMQNQSIENFNDYLGGGPLPAGDDVDATPVNATQLAGGAGQAGLEHGVWYQLPGAEAGVNASTVKAGDDAAKAGGDTGVVSPHADQIDETFGRLYSPTADEANGSDMESLGAAGADLWVAFTPTAVDGGKRIKASRQRGADRPDVAIRFISSATDVKKRNNVWIPRARLQAAGDAAFKSRDALLTIPLTATVLLPSDTSQAPIEIIRVA